MEKNNQTNEPKTKEKDQAAPSIFDELDEKYQVKQKEPGHITNRYVWYLVMAAVLCTCCIFGAVIANHFRLDDPEESQDPGTSDTSSDSQQEEEKELVLDQTDPTTAQGEKDIEKVDSIQVPNPSDSFTITTYTGKEETYDPASGEYVEVDSLLWNITEVKDKDISGVTFNSSTIGFLTGDFLGLPFTEVYVNDGGITVPNNTISYYRECGLDKSVTRLTVTYKDGLVKTLIIGDKVPNGSGYFVCYGYEDNQLPVNRSIYIVPKEAVVFLLKDVNYFVDCNIVEQVPQDEETFTDQGEMIEDPYFISGALSRFDQLTMSGTNYAKPFEFKMVDEDKPGYDSIYLMTSPITQNVDLDAMDTLLGPVANGLTAFKAIAMKPTAAQITEHGLDNPACTVRYVVKNKEYLLNIGKKISLDEDKEAYAVMVKGNPSLFAVDVADLKFVGMNQADFASNTIYSCNITDVKTVKIQTANGVNETYTLTHGVDATGNNSLKVVNSKGAVVDTEAFRDMYFQLLSLNVFANVTDGKDAATPTVTVTLTYEKFNQTDVLRLSPYTDRRYYMSLNGMGSTVVTSPAVDALLQQIAGLVK